MLLTAERLYISVGKYHGLSALHNRTPVWLPLLHRGCIFAAGMPLLWQGCAAGSLGLCLDCSVVDTEGNMGRSNKAETVIEFVDATGAAREMEEKQRQNKLV
eukprot:1137453-Pelagomonas_calceolata.AAC.3